MGLVVLLSSLFVTGCYKVDLSEVSTEISLPSSLAIPLGNVRLSLNKLIEKINLSEEISIDETDTDINLVISQDAEFSFRQIDFSEASFSPISFGYAFEGLPPGFEFEFSMPIEKSFDIDINTDTEVERIDYVILSAFVVELNITNWNDIDINKLEIITDFDEDAVQQLDYNGSVIPGKVGNTFRPTEYSPSGEIAFYNVKVAPSSENSIPLSIVIKARDGESITIGHTSEIGFEYLVKRVEYKIAYGKFPAAIADKNSEQQSIDLSMLEGMRFANPQFEISLQSNIGTYFRFTVDTIRAYREGDVENAKYANFNGSHSTSLDVDVRPFEPGEWVSKSFPKFDAQNGGTDQLFDMDPTPDILEYIFAVSTYTKPGEGNSQQFITPDAEVKINVTGTIPLYFKEGSHIEFKDTLNIGLDGQFNDDDMLEEATLKLTIENGLPVDVDFNIDEFLKADDTPLTTSIKKDYAIKAPELNTDGTVNKTTKQVIDIKLTKAQFDEIKKAESLIYSIKAHQEKGYKIRFRPQDFFDLRVGIFVKGTLSTDSFNSDEDDETDGDDGGYYY